MIPSRFSSILITLTVLLGFALPLRAASLAVAILGTGPAGNPNNLDVQLKLQGTGLFSSVDIINTSTDTPTLAQLLNYQSVLVYSSGTAPMSNRVLLGDRLADYVDAGRGLVVSTFSNASNSTNLMLAGRFHTSSYWSILPSPQVQGVTLSLGTVYDAHHPILSGVTTFSGGSNSFCTNGPLHANSERVADWSNGSPLVAVRTIGTARTVGLNFYPPSNWVREDFWNSATDGAQLMGNALAFAAAPEPSACFLFTLGLVGVGLRLRRGSSQSY